MSKVHLIKCYNEHIDQMFVASGRRRFTSKITWRDNRSFVTINETNQFVEIAHSFILYYSCIMAMTLEYSSSHMQNPLEVYLTFVVDTGDVMTDFNTNNITFDENNNNNNNNNNNSQQPLNIDSRAQIIYADISIDPTLMLSQYKRNGTFFGEIYLIQLLCRMLNKCNGSEPLQALPQHNTSNPTPVPHWNPQYPLFPHQQQSLQWMVSTEEIIMKSEAFFEYYPNDILLFLQQQQQQQRQELTDVPQQLSNANLYYNCPTNSIVFYTPNEKARQHFRGGILADPTGSGKSAIVVALILLSLQQQPQPQQQPTIDSKLYFQSNATLIIVPSYLPQQWLGEIKKFCTAPLQIVYITDTVQHKKYTLEQILSADIVLVNIQYLLGKGYSQNTSHAISDLLRLNIAPHTQSNSELDLLSVSAWQKAVFHNDKDRNLIVPNAFHESVFGARNNVPLESIKFRRIVIDEIHSVLGNPCQRLPALKSDVVWGLSGTPMNEDNGLLQTYVKFFSSFPRYWVPEFTTKFISNCFHRAEVTHFGPLNTHVHFVDLSNREKQLIQCCANQLTLAKMIELCSYFNSSLIDSTDNALRQIHDDIRLLSIDEITQHVKTDLQSKIGFLREKVADHSKAISLIGEKINESKAEMKRHQLAGDQQMSESGGAQLVTESNFSYEQDMLRFRIRRLDNVIRRSRRLQLELNAVERNLGFFNDQLESKGSHPDTCPICMTNVANVIARCGHMYCRICLARCLQQKSQCPMCKQEIKASDVYEIEKNSSESDTAKNRQIALYGSKFTQILDLVNDILKRTPNESVVICSQTTSLMKSLLQILKKQTNLSVDFVGGNSSCQNAAVRKFKQGEIRVLLLSLEYSSAGLDLVESNNLIFSHALVGNNYYVKAMEHQAIARIYRTGQTRPVNIYWFVTRGTVEEQVYLQTR